jgi:hypothetical protein
VVGWVLKATVGRGSDPACRRAVSVWVAASLREAPSAPIVRVVCRGGCVVGVKCYFLAIRMATRNPLANNRNAFLVTANITQRIVIRDCKFGRVKILILPWRPAAKISHRKDRTPRCLSLLHSFGSWCLAFLCIRVFGFCCYYVFFYFGGFFCCPGCWCDTILWGSSRTIWREKKSRTRISTTKSEPFN